MWDPVDIPKATNVTKFLPGEAPASEGSLIVINDDTVGAPKAVKEIKKLHWEWQRPLWFTSMWLHPNIYAVLISLFHMWEMPDKCLTNDWLNECGQTLLLDLAAWVFTGGAFYKDMAKMRCSWHYE